MVIIPVIEIELIESNPGNLAMPCSADFVNEEMLLKVLLANISFFAPTFQKSSNEPAGAAIPAVRSFEVDPKGVPINSVRISWSVVKADYVQINSECPRELFVNPQHLEPGQAIDCVFKDYDNRLHNLTTTGFSAVEFDNLTGSPVELTLQPFLNGIGDPKWSQKRTIIIDPSSMNPQK